MPRRWCIRQVRSPPRRWHWPNGVPTSGADFLLAFALGIEMTCRLSKAISVPPAKGTVAWSQTGITAGIGAAVAAAKLLKLDATRLQYAIGIALSQAAGFRVMHATMVSSLMPAQGAQTGLRAAVLAERGFTASPAALEGRYGFLEVFAETPHVPSLADGLGERFEILRNTYKPYPCGIVIHPIIDACLQLRREHAIDAGGGRHGAHQGLARRDGVVRPAQSAERAAGACQPVSLDRGDADPRHGTHRGAAGPDGARSGDRGVPGQGGGGGRCRHRSGCGRGDDHAEGRAQPYVPYRSLHRQREQSDDGRAAHAQVQPNSAEPVIGRGANEGPGRSELVGRDAWPTSATWRARPRSDRYFAIARRFHSSHGRSTSPSLVFIAAAASASLRNVGSPSRSASLSMRAFTSV